MRARIVFSLLLAAALPLPGRAQQPQIQTTFRVKYVAHDAVYLEGGRAAGLAEGLKLTIRRNELTALASGTSEVQASRIVAQLQVTSVAEASAVCEIRSRNAEIRAGDIAALSQEDVQAIVQQRSLAGTRRYLQVISFTAGEDPFEEEARASVPRPPLPEINRAHGRVGFEYSGIRSHFGSSTQSAQLGVVLRMDMTRIGGTYWNFSGYWRGRLNSRSAATQPQTLTDLVQRTYHLALTYNNPGSRWVAGMGRLYVPWASSLNTIDGGYFGRRLGSAATVGMFAGTTPDPTSWNYNPDRRIAGAFSSLEGGSFEAFRFASTLGLGVSALKWRMERPFAFVENSLFYRHDVAIYHSMEIDRPRPTAPLTGNTLGVSRSYATVRLQPHQRVAFDVSHTYFRDLPTFDPQLVGTGLVDKLLFHGLSGGVRVELPRRITVYSNFGRSERTGDARKSWNQMYGATVAQIWRTGLRGDVRYAKFESAFGRGSYRSLSLSRAFAESLRVEAQLGWQNYLSAQTQQTNSWFLNGTLDWMPGTHYFLETGFSTQRGLQQNYDRWFLLAGYRF